MAHTPAEVARFLDAKRLAVAGVSRQPQQAANAIFRKLRGSGYEVYPINPQAEQVEGVVVATHPDVAADVVRQCADRGVPRVWFHRSFGQGSVSEAAVRACAELGVECIVGGCPLMFCEPVDVAHTCMRWWLQRRGRVPR